MCYAPSAYKGVFAKPLDPQAFNQLYVNSYFVTGPGELDLAPDAMHHHIKASRHQASGCCRNSASCAIPLEAPAVRIPPFRRESPLEEAAEGAEPLIAAV